MHTYEDGLISAEHSLRFASALSKQGVPVELHIYTQGKHGVGLADEYPQLSTWFTLACNWLTAMAWPI
jgi:dipeptidyl aminopeptidase/acylaminoacyl peptidase